MLSVETPFYRPKDKQAQADMKKAKFFQVGTVVARGGVGGGRLSVKCVCVWMERVGGCAPSFRAGWPLLSVSVSLHPAHLLHPIPYATTMPGSCQSAVCSPTSSHPIRTNHDGADRGGPPDAAGRVRGVEERQVQQPLVLRELPPGPRHEARTGAWVWGLVCW